MISSTDLGRCCSSSMRRLRTAHSAWASGSSGGIRCSSGMGGTRSCVWASARVITRAGAAWVMEPPTYGLLPLIGQAVGRDHSADGYGQAM